MTEITQSVAKATEILAMGGIVACPTEGVWGLSCDPWNQRAIAALDAIKGRSSSQKYILVAGRLSHFQTYWPTDQKLLDQWPGPISCVFRPQNALPEHLMNDDGTVCIRWTAHILLQSLSINWGKLLVSTSMNIAGQPPITDTEQAKQWCTDQSIDGLLLGELGDLTGPTHIFDLHNNKYLR